MRAELCGENHRMALWFNPESIREHFEDAPGDVAEWVDRATDVYLAKVGQSALWDERLWDVFGEVLANAVREEMNVPPRVGS